MQARDTFRTKNDDRDYTVICAECQQRFEAKRSDASYCSTRCRKRAHFAPVRKANAIAELERMQVRMREIAQEYPHSVDVFEAMTKTVQTGTYSLGNFVNTSKIKH